MSCRKKDQLGFSKPFRSVGCPGGIDAIHLPERALGEGLDQRDVTGLPL
jgi:hypothetical protein